jgi:hypothetical protein
MKTVRVQSSAQLSAHLLRIINNEFADADRVAELFSEFLGHQFYARSLAVKLLAAARGQAGDGWEVRQLATLMLENQVLKIPAVDMDEWDWLLGQLHLKTAAGTPATVNKAVLKEGYSTTDWREFSRQLRRRLERRKSLHDHIVGKRSSRKALLAFVRSARRDCKLSLARYLFRPEEVVEQILKQIKLSRGLPDLDPFQPPYIEEEIKRSIAQLPDYEARILQALRQRAGIYWVSDVTSSEINSLVEYPLTTVALAIKPPGSAIEFEIKRVGRRGRNQLNVVFRRNGDMVPPSHRLDGGIRQRMLRWEAEMAPKFSRIYRLVHQAEAPISKILSRTSVYNVPVGDTEERLLNYFTEARIFGDGYREMRAAMQAAVDAFNAEEQFIPLDMPGDLGLTIRFLMHINPMQAIMAGTSSFRLDRLALYLSERGPEAYFKDGLDVDYSKFDAKLLADEILEETLGVYRPPEVAYRSHRQYLNAVFALAENRARADQNYLAIMKNFGSVRGTLLAVRGHSLGESFVGRNVGLRSVWEGGQWQIKIIFMDHDDLNVASQSSRDYQALGALSGMDIDDVFIWGTWSEGSYINGAVDYLHLIYRVSDELANQGKDLFHQAMAAAYKRTQREIAGNPELQRFFDATFVDRLRDWDEIAADYLKIRHDPDAISNWKESTRDRLVKKGYAEKVVFEHLSAVEAHADFLERYAFLY